MIQITPALPPPNTRTRLQFLPLTPLSLCPGWTEYVCSSASEHFTPSLSLTEAERWRERGREGEREGGGEGEREKGGREKDVRRETVEELERKDKRSVHGTDTQIREPSQSGWHLYMNITVEFTPVASII